MSVRPSILFSFCAVLCIISSDVRGLQQSNVPSVYDDPLIWSDAVVKGAVAKVEHTDMPAEQWYLPLGHLPKDPKPVQLFRVTLTDIEILRGPTGENHFSVIWLRSTHPEDELKLAETVKVGATLFVTANYRPDWALYLATSIRANCADGWRNVLNELWQAPISETEIKSRVSSVAVPNLTRESDLVLRARVAAHRSVGPDGNSHDEYDIIPEEILKGRSSGPITMVTGVGGPYDDVNWRKRLFGVKPGSTWYFFLKQHGESYIPTAGWRAGFRLEGGQLFERENVPSSYTAAALNRDIRKFASE